MAFWDVSGRHGPDLGRRMRDRLVREGRGVRIELGEWCGRRVLAASPRRVTAAATPTFAAALEALLLAHGFWRVVVVGPVAASPVGPALGREVLACTLDGRPVTSPEVEGLRLPAAHFGAGEAADDDRMACDWCEAAWRAIDTVGVEGQVVGVVVRRDGRAPRSRPLTLARQAGRVLGSLLSGASETAADQPRRLKLATAEALLGARVQ